MFGEVPILGIRLQKTDEKKRIIIPSFAKPSVGEELIVTNGYEKVFSVYSATFFESRIKYLKKLIDSAKSREMLEEYKKELELLLVQAVSSSCVDKQNRIVLPSYLFSRYLEDTGNEFGNSCVVQGAFDHLRVWNVEDFDHYVRKIKK